MSIRADVKHVPVRADVYNICLLRLRKTTCAYLNHEKHAYQKLYKINMTFDQRNIKVRISHYGWHIWGHLALSALGQKELCCKSITLTLSCKMLTALCSCLDLDLLWTAGAWVHYSPVLLCDIITDCS